MKTVNHTYHRTDGGNRGGSAGELLEEKGLIEGDARNHDGNNKLPWGS